MENLEYDALKLAEAIINSVRYPLVILDQDLRVITASQSFYDYFLVNPEETIGMLLYNLGNNQWDIPSLKLLLDNILPQQSTVDNYIVEHKFDSIGKHTMMLNARQIMGVLEKKMVILLAIEDITQREYLEVKLEEIAMNLGMDQTSISSYLKYTQGIINTIRESLIVLDNKYKILFASRYFYEFYNISPKETAGKSLFALIPNHDEVPKLRELMKSVLSEQKNIQNHELKLSLLSTDSRFMRVNIRELVGILGQEQLILLTIEDITEMKKREEERIRNLSKFPEENPNPVLRISIDGNILYANKSSKDLLTYWGVSIGDSLPADMAHRIVECNNSNEILRVDQICEQKTYTLILTPIEKSDYVNIYGEDITDRIKVAKQIEESKILFETVVENIPLMIFLKDVKNLQFVLINQAGEELLGHSRKYLLGKSDRNFFPKKQADYFIARDREVLDGALGIIDIPEEPIETANKGERYLHTRKVRIQGADGKNKYLLGISEDITEQLENQVDLQKSYTNLQKTITSTIKTIGLIVEARDPYTSGHQERVSALAAKIAIAMRLSEETVEGIRLAGSIHDLGKIKIPTEILSKPGKISELEFEIIKTHPQVGYELLKQIEFPWPIAQIILQHHEKLDGSGYPQGLIGDEIILEARIMAVSDIVEAMASHRPYRPALGIGQALRQIEQYKGTLLDPVVVDACLELFNQGYQLKNYTK